MDSSRKNSSLYIDEKVVSTLALLKSGLISPVDKLMGEKEAKEVDETKIYRGVSFPFSSILAPKGKRNHNILEKLQKGDVVDLINLNKKVGEIIVDEVFPIDIEKRLINIYGTKDTSHPGVRNTISRLGKIAISGEYTVDYPLIQDNINRIQNLKEKINATTVSSMMLSANPFNRAHERMIRQALNDSDMLVIFLRKPFTTDGLRYDIRYNALSAFIDNFLPNNRVIIIPFENSYMFSGYNELILDALISKNYGCNQLVVGKNHGGLGLYYDKNRLNSILDDAKELDIDIKTIDEYVYCDTCNTLVTTNTCQHGQHNHIHYHSESILQLIQSGLIPPAILMRKEVSASILTALFPERFKNLQEMHYYLMPGSGLLEQQSEEQFYLNLMKLYQTSSLT
ncbi:MAG: sulfate adenylyltransferase [Sulfurovum sp.]